MHPKRENPAFYDMPASQLLMYDEWEQEFHLTPHGWIAGCFFFRGDLTKFVVLPSDRVLTLVREVLHRSETDGPTITWCYEWKCKDRTQEEIDQLLAEFGHRPTETKLSPQVRNSA